MRFRFRNCNFLCSFLCFISVSAQTSHHIVLEESGSANILSYSLCHPDQVWWDCTSLICLFGALFREKRVYLCCLHCKDLPQWANPLLVHLGTGSQKWVWVNGTMGQTCWVRVWWCSPFLYPYFHLIIYHNSEGTLFIYFSLWRMCISIACHF